MYEFQRVPDGHTDLVILADRPEAGILPTTQIAAALPEPL